MKMIYQTLVIASILAYSSTIFANSLENTCPPRDLIKLVKFVTAKKSTHDEWLLRSEGFTYNNNTWQVLLGTNIVASTEQEALQVGQVYFVTQAHIVNPTNLGIFCSYTDGTTNDLILAERY